MEASLERNKQEKKCMSMSCNVIKMQDTVITYTQPTDVSSIPKIDSTNHNYNHKKITTGI